MICLRKESHPSRKEFSDTLIINKIKISILMWISKNRSKISWRANKSNNSNNKNNKRNLNDKILILIVRSASVTSIQISTPWSIVPRVKARFTNIVMESKTFPTVRFFVICVSIYRNFGMTKSNLFWCRSKYLFSTHTPRPIIYHRRESLIVLIYKIIA